MEIDRTVTGLVLDVLEFEVNDPDKPDYLKIGASVRVHSFFGATVFWVTEVGIDAFAAELTAFGKSLKGNPELRCGVGNTVLFKMSVVLADNLGHANVRLEVRSENFPPENIVIVEFGLEPQQLIDFATDLQRAIIGPQSARAHLPDLPYYHSNAGRPHPGERLH